MKLDEYIEAKLNDSVIQSRKIIKESLKKLYGSSDIDADINANMITNKLYNAKLFKED